MDATTTCRGPRRAFTLIEMLAVIVIIGILSGLITAAAMRARTTAKNAVIVTELNQLDMALKAYKEKCGSYPPDFFGVSHADMAIRAAARQAVLRHLAKRFPRYRLIGATPVDKWNWFAGQVGAYGLDVNALTPASALVFWLGGLPENDGGGTPGNPTFTGKLIGFSANPADPFHPGEDIPGRNGVFDGSEDTNNNGVFDRGSRLAPLFEFSETRLLGYNATTKRWDYPPMYAAEGIPAPYVYFRARKDRLTARSEYAAFNSTTNKLEPFSYAHPPTAIVSDNVCVPYLQRLDSLDDDQTVFANPQRMRHWMNPDTFQIIAPGLDEIYGNGSQDAFREAKTGFGFSPDGGDYDNIGNFSGGTLEDQME